MGSSVVVDSNNFATEVIQQSYQKPILVDFFATWCGPCQMLKPMLEKLNREYDFVLAKVDIDQNPDLANSYGVEGVPDVRIVTQGQVMNGFVGVLPEPKLRELLVGLNLKSALELGLDALQQAKASGNVEQIKQLFRQLSEQFPDDRRVLLEAAQFLINQGSLDSAERLLDSVQIQEKDVYPKAQALKSLIQFKQELEQPGDGSELDQLFRKAAQLSLLENYEEALQLFLSLVERDRSFRNDGARKAMLTLFDILGDSHPLTITYRKQLMMTLY